MRATGFFLSGIGVCSLMMAAARADELPRYALKVGDEIVFHHTSEFAHTSGKHISKADATIWVTKRNTDGSWHLVGRGEQSFQQVSDKTAIPPQKHHVFGTFDLSPDGTVKNLQPDVGVEMLKAGFVPLPADAEQAAKGWEKTDDGSDTDLYRLLPGKEAGSSTLTIEHTTKGAFADVYQSTSHDLLTFDLRRGMVAHGEMENTQGYGFQGKGTGKMEVKVQGSKPAEWVAQLQREAELYVTVHQQERAATHDKTKSGPERAEAATKALREGRDSVKLPEVQEVFDQEIARMKDYGKYVASAAEEEDRVQDKPAADWKTTDLDGREHKLTDYRGKVVVLDFWYRGCGWCLRAMPQIKELVTDFQGKPVAFLGMNTDHKEEDARFVSTKLELNYPTLKATGVPETYAVSGFPTLIIIDQEGVVRGRHVGYSPKLREEVGQKIAGLLAK